MAVKIDGVAEKSRAQRAGIRPGDVLVTINGHEIVDVLDYRFFETERELRFRPGAGRRALPGGAGQAPVRGDRAGVFHLPDG